MVLLFALAAPRAHAQDPYACIDELTEPELDQRIGMIDAHFQRGKRRVRAHWYGFLTLFAAISVGQVFMAAYADEQVDRFSNTVGGVGAFLMSLQIAILPQVAAIAPQRFRRMPEDTLQQRRDKIRYGLGRFELAARRTRTQRGWSAIATPLVWSAVWSTVIMRKFDSPLTVLRLVGGGIVITQARFWLTPLDSLRSWQSLRGSFCGGRYVHRFSELEMHDMVGHLDEEDGEPTEADDPTEPVFPVPEEPEGMTQVMPSLMGLHLRHTF